METNWIPRMMSRTMPRTMIKKMDCLLALLLCLMALLLFPSHSYSALGAMRISLIDGDVQMKTEDTSDWVPASVNTPLTEGDRLWVPDGGKTELHLKDGTHIRLNENSSIDILTVDKDSFQFYLSAGQLYANYRGLKDGFLQIDTPFASVRVYEKTVFRIDAPDSGNNRISVFRGEVYAENKNEKIRVEAKNTLSLNENYTELSALGPVDNWERWNRQRDDDLSVPAESTKYLPEELSSYSGDFEKNGKWVRTNDYGNVWRPVVTSPDWAPYSVGRWVWMRGDYVWVSYEPWGWAPYHYGRWVYISSLGWSWIPPSRGAVYWGPGFVGWVHTPTTVAWVPLAPGEIYYGHGYYGPGSVNITNINIINIERKKKVVYKNIYVNNAVTVVNQKTFVTGKGGKIRTKDNPFVREKISIGRPNIKPEKESSMPVVRDIPHTKHPPLKIKEVRVKEVKEKRPMVKEKTVSVIKKGPAREVKPLKTEEPVRTQPLQVQPSEKRERHETEPDKKRDEVREEPATKRQERPEKLKDSEIAPQERQKLKKKFEKRQKTETEAIERRDRRKDRIEKPSSGPQKETVPEAPEQKKQQKGKQKKDGESGGGKKDRDDKR